MAVDGIVGPATLKALGMSTSVLNGSSSSGSSSSGNGTSFSNADVTVLARLIYGEARGESDTGQIAVGAVVMNRVRSAAFPNSIADVIYASGQFTPAMTGTLQEVYDRNGCASCTQAANEAISGNTNVGESKYFRRAGKHEGYVIGNHVFW